MSDELKPCPCCGGVPERMIADCGGHYIRCHSCNLSTCLVYPIMDDVREQLAARWNRRVEAQPPYGADGAVRDVAALASAVRDIPDRIKALGGQRFAYVKLSEVIDTIYAHASQPAAPVAPAAVAVPDCEWCQDDDVHLPGTWDGACGAKWTFTDGGPKENDVRFCMKCGGHVLLAASQREGGGT